MSPWICNPRVFEVRIYNPLHHFGSQTLILRNCGLQIRSDGNITTYSGYAITEPAYNATKYMRLYFNIEQKKSGLVQ